MRAIPRKRGARPAARAAVAAIGLALLAAPAAAAPACAVAPAAGLASGHGLAAVAVKDGLAGKAGLAGKPALAGTGARPDGASVGYGPSTIAWTGTSAVVAATDSAGARSDDDLGDFSGPFADKSPRSCLPGTQRAAENLADVVSDVVPRGSYS